MFGKGSLIVATGFSIVMGLYSGKMNRLTVTNSDHVNTGFMSSVVHEGAISGMNYGINHIWANLNNDSNFTIYMTPCTTTVTIRKTDDDTVIVKSISRGVIRDDEYWEENQKYLPIIDSSFATFTYNIPVSKWFYITNDNMGIYWTTGDTVWGPMHCNKTIHTNGAPVFYSKVTARLGITPPPNKNGSQAKYYGGWEIGINSTIPTDLSRIRNLATEANNGAPNNTVCKYDSLLTLKFLNNGTVIRTVGYRPTDTVSVATIAPTGILWCTKDIHISGILDGQLTMLSDDDIWIDDDFVYKDDPLAAGGSDDLCGLVSIDDVIIANNYANNHDVNLNACILASSGSFTAEDYSTRPIAGVLKVVGSLAQNTRGPVGTFSGNSINHGFSKRYYFDPKLSLTSPPNYPFIRSLRLSSWWE